MKNNKALGVTVVCILLLSLSLVPSLIDATPDSFNMYVTVDEEGSDVALKVYLAGREGPLSKATVEYELFTAQGVPLGVEGEMEKVASGVWCSSVLPLAGNLGEVCALVQANRRGYPPQERRYYFPVAASMTSAADGLSNPGLGMMAIRQEFVWDDASGTFQTVNIYTIGYVEDIIADMEQVLTSGAPGDGLILGRDCGLPYYYWQDSASWHTLANRTRYKGYDIRAEATATRGDNIFTQGCADGYDRVVSCEAWASVVLANDWEIDVIQEYTQWGHEVKLTAPDGIRYSTVCGDPHLLQKGGTQQQELAAVGEYVFHLGPDVGADYTLNLICMKMNVGFSLVTAMNITGPDNYLLTMGRNGEIKISGGSGGGSPQARPSLPGEPEIEFIEAPRNGAALYGSEVTIRVEANECLQNATLHFGGDSYPMTDMDVDKELRWEKTLSGLDFDTYSFYVTGTDLDGDSGSSSERQVTLQAVPLILVPTSLDFGEVTVGEDSDPQEVTVTNGGDADLTISNISIIGPDASEFSQTNNCLGALSPGASCTVNVTFSPNSEGAKVAGLLIQGSYLSGGRIKIFAVNVALSGTGVVLPPAAVGGEAYPVNKLAVLAPWIVLAVLLVSSMSWFMLRRRKA